MTSKDELKRLSEQLEQGVRDIFNDGQYQKYLQTMGQFHKYSYRNTLLILMQNPDATRVAGFTTWKRLGRYVKRGEKGIQILAPAPVKRTVEEDHDRQGRPLLDETGNPNTVQREITIPAFKPAYVFDISQTGGEPLPSRPKAFSISLLTGNVENYENVFSALRGSSPFPIELEDIKIGAEGYTDFTNQRIAIQDGRSQAQNIAVTLHEIAHARLHADRRSGKARSTKEVEAESVAYVVSAHYGIQTDSTSFSYIADWSRQQGIKELQHSLDTIQKAAAELIQDIDHHTELLQQQANAVEKGSVQIPQKLDMPFVPPIELMSIDNGEYEVFEKGRMYPLDDSDIDNVDFFRINTIDLKSGACALVGFSREREYTFETDSYRHFLFESGAVSIGTPNLQFSEYPGSWEITADYTYRGAPFYIASEQGNPGNSIILDQSGDIFSRDLQKLTTWDRADLYDLISSTRAEKIIQRTNNAPIEKPRITPKVSIAKQLSAARQITENSVKEKPFNIRHEQEQSI